MVEIRHIDEVLPWIEGRKEFVVKRDPSYIAVDYNITFFDSFDDPRRIELRGLKFHPDGEIMARPLHKFFNVGEREDTQPHALDFDSDHLIMDKLDGSMIHPAILRDGSVRFMTRMGMTDVARKAERHLTEQMAEGIRALLADGFTPVFEFTAPDNRIVVKYPDSGLTLLAIRNTVTGIYVPREMVEDEAAAMGVRAVRVWPKPSSGAELIETVRALKGAEGIVCQLGNGLWVKIKGEEYALMHKAKDSITREKNVLAVLLDGKADDLRPLLTEEDRKPFDQYAERLDATLRGLAAEVDDAVSGGASLDQKAFATEHLGAAPAWLRAVAFPTRAGKHNALEGVRLYLRKHCGSQTDVDAIRPLLGFNWDGPVVDEDG